MAEPALKSTGQCVIEALEKALMAGGEVRLITSGKRPETAGLFHDEKGTRKAAVERCLHGEPAFLKIARTEEVRVGTAVQAHRFVTITPAGIDFLFTKLPPERAADLFRDSLRQVTAEVRRQQEQLEKLTQSRQQIVETVQGVIQQFGEISNRLHAAALDSSEKEALLKARLDTLPLPRSLLSTTPTRPPLRRASTEEESRFRQRAAQEVVFAWQGAAAEAREPIEHALFNIGAEPIGRAGECVEFVASLHEASEPLFPGDAVEIVRPGWLLRDELGGYLLAHAQVKALQKTQ